MQEIDRGGCKITIVCDRQFLLTSLLGKTRAEANNDDVDVSSTVFDDIWFNELLSKVEFNIADCIWTLFFLSNGFRGGKTGGISCPFDPFERAGGFCNGNEDFFDNKFFLREFCCSSSWIAADSTVGGACLFRPGLRLN